VPYSARTWVERVVRALPRGLRTDDSLVAAIREGRGEDAYARVQALEQSALDDIQRFEAANPRLTRLGERYPPRTGSSGEVYFGGWGRHHPELNRDTISELSWFYEERSRLVDLAHEIHEGGAQARWLLKPQQENGSDS
jgi:hypothetical protein